MDWIALFAACCSAVATCCAAIAAYRTFQATQNTFKENRNLVYLQFYQIIERHHSEELTSLRRIVRSELPSKGKTAKKRNKPLIQIYPDFHSKVSALANYYESLGMFLEGNWGFLPEEAKDTMCKMLHNSTVAHWEDILEYKNQIHPNPPKDWGGSFQWLYEQMKKYKSDHNLY